MSHARGLLKRIQPALRRFGWDLVPYPGANFALLRSKYFESRQVDLVIDVGANVGQYGRCLRSSNYGGAILSFEPMSAAFAELQALAATDDCWTAVRSALGEERASLDIHISENSISSSLLPMLDRHAEFAPRSAYVGTETVPVDRLDVLAAGRVKVASSPFLKLDTQGYESAVLDGAGDVLARMVGIEIELSLVPLYEGQLLMPEMLEKMRGLGFRLCAVTNVLVDHHVGETLQFDGIFAPLGQ